VLMFAMHRILTESLPSAVGAVPVRAGTGAVIDDAPEAQPGVAPTAPTDTSLEPASVPVASRRPLSVAHSLRRYAYLLCDRTFLGYSLLGGFAMGGLFAYITGAPTVLPRTYELSPQQFGWLIGVNGFTFMLASRLNLRALRKYSPATAVSRHVWLPLGFGAVLLLTASLVTPPLWLLLTLQLSYFVGVGRVTPHTAALALAPHGQDAGAASALMGTLQSLIATITAVMVAAVNDGTVRTLSMIMLAAAVCSVLSYAWVSFGERRSRAA